MSNKLERQHASWSKYNMGFDSCLKQQLYDIFGKLSIISHIKTNSRFSSFSSMH